MKTLLILVVKVSIHFRDIRYNKASPFYSYSLRDIYFSNLKCFYHPADPRNKDKLALLDHMSKAAVPLSRNNNVFQGLPIPPLLKQSVAALNGKIRHWILAFHGFDELVLFVLFPSGQDHDPEVHVELDRDLTAKIYKNIQEPAHSLHVDALYVWPWTILIKDDQKIRDGSVFDVPKVFLDREDVLVKDDRRISRMLNDADTQELIETMTSLDTKVDS